eukprot:CAMPEP_0194031682 /NCGR_PEP_ID=MMETSP0009_2-20130614/4795_1 /TAXON_ID=210454 /ORGANISM="Grammatophora oceanica, Strain CCMP 410" /LENGTH=156 /DNA_ID=CAMNT_0038671899 /DNA_START=43 /DNA_END=513 /DNA_ORIENTATION=+
MKNLFRRKQHHSPSGELNPKEVNKMLTAIPEIATAKQLSYYRYPLLGTHWSSTRSVNIHDLPGFVPATSNNFDGTVIKPNYVYGKGNRGFGYYHLMTQDSWKILAKRESSSSDIAWLLRQRAKSNYRNDKEPLKLSSGLKEPPKGETYVSILGAMK